VLPTETPFFVTSDHLVWAVGDLEKIIGSVFASWSGNEIKLASSEGGRFSGDAVRLDGFSFEESGDAIEVRANIKDGLAVFKVLYGNDGFFMGTGEGNSERLAVSSNDNLTFYMKNVVGITSTNMSLFLGPLK